MTKADTQPNTTDTDSASRDTLGRYVVITPCRNEEDYLQQTIDSLAAQTVKPARWVVVDDGSTDATPDLVRAAAKEHDWIRLVQREKRPDRRVGGGVVLAFEAGLESLADQDDPIDYDFLCKLDGDLRVGPRYFQTLLECMAAEPRLGTLSGKCYLVTDGEVRWEKTSDEFSLGAAKFYRRTCFEAIGGFVREVMWDGIDCHRCRLLGWKAASIHHTDLEIHHLRQMGSSHKGVLHGRRRHGRGQYFMGTHPIYMLASGVYRMLEKPYIIGGLNMMYGYVAAALRGDTRYDDPVFRRYLRRWQMAKLLPWVKNPVG